MRKSLMQRSLLSFAAVLLIGGGLVWWHANQSPGVARLPILENKAYQQRSRGAPRLALVIGNGKGYGGSGFRPLLTPESDAEAMAKTLTDLGFQVTTAINADKATMEGRVRALTDAMRAQDGGTGLFYFSGHGVGLKRSRRNFLIPIKARIGNEADVPYQAVEANWVVERMQATNPHGVNLVFLDACRSYDVPSLTMSGGTGLAEMPNPQGTLIAYATAPGKVAYTAPRERHSVFTASLLRLLQDEQEAGTSVASLMIDLTAATETHSLGLIEALRVHSPQEAAGLEPQTPWVAMSLRQHFCFREPCLLARHQDDSAQRQMEQKMQALQERQVVLERMLREQQRPREGTPSEALRTQRQRDPQGQAEAAQQAAPLDRPTPIPAQGLDPELVGLPGGCFQMGSPASEQGRYDWERQHQVCVKGFAIGKYEVTVGEFRRFVEASGHRMGQCDWPSGKDWRDPGFSQGDDHPVACVSWNDAVAYAQWLSGQTRKDYHLPTEAEWEYAARGGTSTRFWWGDQDPICRKGARNGAKFDDNATCNDTGTEPVGSYQANPYGLYDTAGNVWEWTCSAWANPYDGSERGCQMTGDADRVFRGGCWRAEPRYLRSAFRSSYSPGSRVSDLGFRLARTL